MSSVGIKINGHELEHLEDFGPIHSVEVSTHDGTKTDVNETYVDDIFYRCQSARTASCVINSKSLECIAAELMALREIIQTNRGAISREDMIRFDKVTSSTDIQITLARRE